MTAPVQPTITRSQLVFIVLGAAALVFGVANVVGSQFFPYNAPVEQIEAFGITVDCVAVLILAVIGVLVARQPLSVKPASVLAIVGAALTAVVLLIALIAWGMSLVDLAGGTLLHYSNQVGATLILAPVFITGLAFSGFAYRRGGTRLNNLFSVLGLAFGMAILFLAALAAVLYGLGLTT